MFATVFGQALGILTLPVKSRLYTDFDYAHLLVFVVVTNTITVFSSGRYDILIPSLKEDKDATNMVWLALSFLVSSFLVSFIILFICYHFGLWYDYLEDSIYFVPVFIFLLAHIVSMTIIRISTYILNRIELYNVIATSRILTGILVAVFIIGFGFLNIEEGLVFGTFLGTFLGGFIMCVRAFQKVNWTRPKFSEIKALAIEHKDQFLFTSPNTFFVQFRENFVVTLIERYFGGTVLGSFSFARRLIKQPIILLGSAVGEVYIKKSSKLYNTNPEALRKNAKMLILGMLLISIPMILVLVLFGPQLFAFFFGEKWRFAGKIAYLLSPLIPALLATSPLSYIIVLTKKQRVFMFYGILTNIFIPAAFYVAMYFWPDVTVGFLTLSFAEVLVRIVSTVWIFWFVRVAIQQFKDRIEEEANNPIEDHLLTPTDKE